MTLLLLPLLAVLLVGSALAFHWLHAQAPARPPLSADVVARTLTVGGRERRYLTYLPATLGPHAPLLLVLHGAGQTAEAMRCATGYAFERLADQRGFAVAYPDAFERNWNDGRRALRHSARTLNVDDRAFIGALIDKMFASQAIALGKVFVFGYSNGGHMAFRMAQEMPERLGAIAAVGANLPTPANSIARPRGEPMPVMIVNGTEDPINPYEGGKLSLFGFRQRGEVRSSRASADYFARLNSAVLTQTAEHRSGRDGDPTHVVKQTWSAGGEPRVLLYTVDGGGHVIPQPWSRAPRLLGRKTTALDAPGAACDFFGL